MPVELRSDTFTQPTPAMRQAIANAVCGDDMVGEDPTVNRLEQMVAERLGKEAAVFACSGTQSNQMGVWTHCRTGDELLIESTGHIANYEGGAPAVLSGVSCRYVQGDGGLLSVDDVKGQLRPPNQHFSPTRLLCLENSTNLGGGRTYSLQQFADICQWAHEHDMKVHLDGARLFNACAAQGYDVAELVSHVDTVSICFSKGLGCPMGSALVGTAEDIARARRARKLFGGALRQAGIVAAAAIHALEHHVERLVDDHANARLFAERLAELDSIRVDLERVETNLVFFEVDAAWGTAAQFSHLLKERGVHINPAGGPQRLRACTHLDVSEADVIVAAEAIRDILSTTVTESATAIGTYG
ncbi:MAG: low specificity L-threonine aldolase [Planctomycetaceae bacterium]|nr:low specificity L-threonine aldolase [Planctomycetaceae bacterium]MCB9951086.1 low specificity L-threonine aldolase [Planctomycetaceae bacterium]